MITYTLNNGVIKPALGLGTYLIPNDEVFNVVTNALEIGYRAIDTAQFYQNETGIGKALKESTLNRDELFITTKVWNSHQGYDKTMAAFEASLQALQLDYIDLYLIHWPTPMYDKYVETYKALEKLYEDGVVKAIGVSNFHIEHLERIANECNVKPVVNQVECHPYFQQQDVKKYCAKHNIYVESWSPLGRGRLLEDKTIKHIAKRHDKTAAQVIIRWHLEEQSIVIPKSVTRGRLEENFNVFDFSLTKDELATIAELDRHLRTGHDPNEMDIR
ncbi:MAG TPA: aldo/keto reductase [Pseudogracilibacillus sp.]|nr:aldo/keto reductase [Pseudogracilibacillus sp.]